jgi:hypothetical protein
VTVAVSLLGVATMAVLAALPTQSPGLLSAAAVLAIVLGWAALRICWTEVLQSRRENAADRAATAQAYRSLFTERAAEHAEFTSAMTERLAEATLSLREYQGALAAAQDQLRGQRVRADRAESATAEARIRIAELERSVELLRADAEVEDLVAFDEKVAQRSTQKQTKAGKHAAPEEQTA